jgi:hypothetical protein
VAVMNIQSRQPTRLVYVAYLGAVLLITGLLTFGVGLLRTRQPRVGAAAGDISLPDHGRS